MQFLRLVSFFIVFLMIGCATNQYPKNDFQDYRINYFNKDSASVTYIQGQYEKYDDVIEKSKMICSTLLKINPRRLGFNIVSSKEVNRYIFTKFMPTVSFAGFHGKDIRDVSSSPTLSNQGEQVMNVIKVFEITSNCSIIPSKL